MTHPLKAYRAAAGLTQEQLAASFGVSNITVSRWETGRRRIDASKLPQVVEKTGIPARELRPDLAELMEVTQ